MIAKTVRQVKSSMYLLKNTRKKCGVVSLVAGDRKRQQIIENQLIWPTMYYNIAKQSLEYLLQKSLSVKLSRVAKCLRPHSEYFNNILYSCYKQKLISAQHLLKTETTFLLIFSVKILYLYKLALCKELFQVVAEYSSPQLLKVSKYWNANLPCNISGKTWRHSTKTKLKIALACLFLSFSLQTIYGLSRPNW